MALLEEVPDEDQPSSSLRNRKNPEIPLQHPSTLPPSSSEPLIKNSPPETSSSGPSREGSMSPSEIDEQLKNGTLPKSEKDEERERDIWDEVFDTALLTIPFSFLYLLLDILVHLQYSFRPKIPDLMVHMLRAVPTLGIITWYTNSKASHFATVPLLMAASIFCGGRMIWLVNKASWSVVTSQAPAMGAVWTMTIVQLPLSRAILCLAIVAGWSWWSGMKLQP